MDRSPPSLAPFAAIALALALTGCASQGEREAARFNADGLTQLNLNLFGRPEQGWAVYAPAVQATVRTKADPDSTRFAAAVARWKAQQGLASNGVVDAATLIALKADWQARRPFVALRARGICPDPPPDDVLAIAAPQETLGGKPIPLRQRALWAYRRMVQAARRAGVTQGDPSLLALFSGYRDPAADAARCAAEGNCQGIVRAACSAHRTGLALDLNLGSAPGLMVDNSSDANRLYQTRTPAYRWLVRNAARFGFVNYVFEPWHWEWTGEAP